MFGRMESTIYEQQSQEKKMGVYDLVFTLFFRQLFSCLLYIYFIRFFENLYIVGFALTSPCRGSLKLTEYDLHRHFTHWTLIAAKILANKVCFKRKNNRDFRKSLSNRPVKKAIDL